MSTQNGIEVLIADPLSGDEVRRLAREVPTEKLYPHIYSTHERTARNAAWIMTHKPAQEISTLPQEELVELTLKSEDVTIRRLTLNLIERQGIEKEDIRTDLLDYCLEHMVRLDEPPGIQSLCMKLAYGMCRHYPELLHEFNENLSLMQPENYKPGMRHMIKKLFKN